MILHVRAGDNNVAIVDSSNFLLLAQYLNACTGETEVIICDLRIQTVSPKKVTEGEAKQIAEKNSKNKLQAIKDLRELYQVRSGETLGLKEAKDWIERYI